MIAARAITLRQTVVCAAVFMAVGLAIGWRSLAYDWHWDDLHLVRVYTGPEIVGSFFGTWDPDGIETKGLRPLTVLFNDARARLFGEWTLGHRVFLIALFSGYLTALGALACRLGAPWWAALAAGVLTLCAKNSYYHFIWIADGIHLVPAVFFVAAAHVLLRYLDTGRTRLGVLSGLLLLLALAAREDALALYGVVVLIGAAYLWFADAAREAYWRLARYVAILFGTFLPFWTWRLLVVPRAPNFRANYGVLTQPLTMVRWTVSLSGQADGWWVAFSAGALLLVAAAFVMLSRDERRRSLLWLLLAIVACLPGAVIARANLLLFPVSFYALFVVMTIAYLAPRSRVIGVAGALALVAAASLGVRASRLEQWSVHSRSTDKIAHDWFGLYSKARFTSIPPERLARTKESLARFGIVDETFDFAAWEQDLRRRHRVGFVDDDDAFVPERKFLTP